VTSSWSFIRQRVQEYCIISSSSYRWRFWLLFRVCPVGVWAGIPYDVGEDTCRFP